MNAVEHYRKTTNIEPYPHQVKTYEALEQGKSIILRAPTGSGKSEAVFIPFLTFKGTSLPNRMIYSLPIRALVDSLHRRFCTYAPHLDIKAQHGQRPESVLFDADCTVATLDQVITSYVCSPLSLGIRHGNIPAGAVTSSFMVFDEVHTFEPALGLQSSIILAERLRQMNIPFLIMSATLPSAFINVIQRRLKAKFIDVEERFIPIRSNREVTLFAALQGDLSAEKVLEHYNHCKGRTIVVCNTVERAISLYSTLVNEVSPRPILIHSRFLDNDRIEKEKVIARLFGKEGTEKALLISTQVIEVGMDISCDLLLTELAPIDALIQRAGRCARWGGNGKVVIFDIPSHHPYDRELTDMTRNIIGRYNGQRLSWNLEKTLVDQILGDTFKDFASPHAGAKAMLILSRAAFEGKASIAEKAVRETLSVEITIHDAPEMLGEKVFLLPRCRLHPGILNAFVKKKNPTLWLIEEDKAYKDDYKSQIHITPVTYSNRICTNRLYVLHRNHAVYSQDEGLILGKRGTNLKPSVSVPESSNFELGKIPLETWQEHAVNTLEAFEQSILPCEQYVYHRLALFLGIKVVDFFSLMRLILVLHDLGKLTQEWQKGIGAGDKPLAHSGNVRRIILPPHATVSAYVLRDYLRENWGKICGDAAFFAIVHHHSVRATKIPKYRLCHVWHYEVNEVLSSKVGVVIERDEFTPFEVQDSPTVLSNRFPAFEKEKLYALYIILSRALRLSDRIATGGKYAMAYHQDRPGDF